MEMRNRHILIVLRMRLFIDFPDFVQVLERAIGQYCDDRPVGFCIADERRKRRVDLGVPIAHVHSDPLPEQRYDALGPEAAD